MLPDQMRRGNGTGLRWMESRFMSVRKRNSHNSNQISHSNYYYYNNSRGIVRVLRTAFMVNLHPIIPLLLSVSCFANESHIHNNYYVCGSIAAAVVYVTSRLLRTFSI